MRPLTLVTMIVALWAGANGVDAWAAQLRRVARHRPPHARSAAHVDSAVARKDSMPAVRGDSVRTTPDTLSAAAAIGKRIYEVRCIACHRPDGSGGIKFNGNPTPDWRDARRMADPRFGDDYLRDCITHGKPQSGMPAWSQQGVTPVDVERLLAYLHTFARKP